MLQVKANVSVTKYLIQSKNLFCFVTFFPESSVHEGSICNDNDGSICGSDSAFYRQSEGERRPTFSHKIIIN